MYDNYCSEHQAIWHAGTTSDTTPDTQGCNMLSIEQCRRFLGSDCDLSDEQVEALRDQLYALADIAAAAYQEKQDGNKHEPPRVVEDQIETIGANGDEGSPQVHV